VRPIASNPEFKEESVSLQETYRVEIAKWDALAQTDRPDDALMLADPDFDAHARRVGTLRGVSEFLGDLRGREVLEMGCGLGRLTTLLACSGAQVSAFDLSPGSVDVARRRAELHGVGDAVDVTVAAAEDMPYADESFDVVIGKGVLHHLDVALAGPELHRVLRPGGRAAFTEPLGTNPLVAFARDHVPYPHKNPRGADEPLSYEAVHAWGAPFSEFAYREIELLSMVRRAFGIRRPLQWLTALDDRLLARRPGLRRFCRYVVMTMVK
jgi:SAM-dependent methyltransferase